MQYKFSLIIVLLFIQYWCAAQQPREGKLITLHNVNFGALPPRPVKVWLPRNYDSNIKHQVLYMQDGQMLFDSNTTWNHKEWFVDENLQALIDQKKVLPTIVVAIDNLKESRYKEYYPFSATPISKKAFNEWNEMAYKKDSTNTNADMYLEFIVKNLMPLINSSFNTYTTAKHTYIGGSSMGGLLSWYAMCEYPQVFGGAICMSTHWPGSKPEQYTANRNPYFDGFYNYLNSKIEYLKNNKIYFDYGDKTLDAYYAPYQQKIDKLFKTKKFPEEKYFSKQYHGAEHDEFAWAERFAFACEWTFN